MSFSQVSDPFEPDPEADDETSTAAPASPGPRANPRLALARVVLEAAMTPAIRAMLAAKARLVVIEAPSAAWAVALEEVIDADFRGCSTRTLIEAKRKGASSRYVGDDVLIALNAERTVVVLTQDAAAYVLPHLLGAADAVVKIPPITAKLVRKAVHSALGKHAPGLTDAELVGLDFDQIASAIRADSTGGEVVRRLRRVRAKKALPANLDRTPKLEEIPLCRSVRAWANQMIDDLRRVDAGKITPAELPGVVLEGPPGVGKTLIASALAKSAGWQFLSTSVGDWFGSSDGHLGGVSKACTRFFDELLAGERVIGLIDEIDALPDRASLDAKDLQWWNSIITLMLLQIDRIRKSGKPILLLGATNYFSRLDAALVRPGRLEQRVPVLPATSQAEIAALFAHFLSSELGPESVTRATRLAGQATPAAVEAWVRGARARARTENRALVEEDLLLAIAPPDERAPGILRIAALHEAGHALVAKRLGIAVTEVSIIAQGQMGGVTRTQPVSMFPTRQDVQDMATTLLAGRAADLVLNGGAHAGAQADLAMATKLLADAMAAWGLYDTLVDTSPALGGSTRLSPALAQAVNLELKRLLKRAVTMVEAEPALVHRLADALLRQRVLGAAEIEQIIQTEPLRKVPDATPDPVVGTANPGVPQC